MAGELMLVAMTLRRLSPDFSIVARAPETWTRRMTLRHLATTSLLALALTTGCSPMPHGDPDNPQKNPHPVQRYEVIATADAPGSWDSVKGTVFFQIVNPDCVPADSFTGGQNVPNTGYHFEMTRVNETTWKGYFFRDMLQDDDYFGLGVCHWDVTQASPAFSVHGENFVPGSGLENIRPLTRFFEKSEFRDSSRTDAAMDFPATNPKYAKNPEDFFPITVTVKELTP